MEFEPIGVVHADRSEVLDDDWDAVRAAIVLDGRRFGPASLSGLDEFSHIEVVYVFNRVEEAEIATGARRPRGNPAWPEVGIFAQRARVRPNRIGVTVCTLLGVDDLTVHVRGLDALDQTPVLDLKPYMAEFGPRGEIRQPRWSHEVMVGYWSRPPR